MQVPYNPPTNIGDEETFILDFVCYSEASASE